MEQFAKDISVLEKSSIEKAFDIIQQQETATIFVGRSTCPYCRRFATKLNHVVTETNAKVLFVNSANQEELERIQQFRTQYNIPTVPGFVQINKGTVNVRCDSSMSLEEIKAFMAI